MRRLVLFLAAVVLVGAVLSLPRTSDVASSQTNTTSSGPRGDGTPMNTSKPTATKGATNNTTFEPFTDNRSEMPSETKTAWDEEPSRTNNATAKRESLASTTIKPGTTFKREGDSVVGVYVRFILDVERCALDAVRVQGIDVFVTVELGGGKCKPQDVSEDRVGTRFTVTSAAGSLLIVDHPQGLIRFDAAEGRFLLAPGMSPRPAAKGVVFGDGTLDAVIVPTGGGTAVSDGYDVFVQGKGSAFVRNVVEANRSGTATSVESELVSKGRLGGRIDIEAVAEGRGRASALPFDDVEIQADVPARDHVRIRLTSGLSEGRAFVTSFPPGAFATGALEVRYFAVAADGTEVRGAIQRLDSVEAVLLSPEPAYVVLREGELVTVVLNVPHWSTHLFEVLHIPAQAAPIVLYGVVFVALFASTGALGLVLGWRARHRRAGSSVGKKGRPPPDGGA